MLLANKVTWLLQSKANLHSLSEDGALGIEFLARAFALREDAGAFFAG